MVADLPVRTPHRFADLWGEPSPGGRSLQEFMEAGRAFKWCCSQNGAR